jgi:hypothetical protein
VRFGRGIAAGYCALWMRPFAGRYSGHPGTQNNPRAPYGAARGRQLRDGVPTILGDLVVHGTCRRECFGPHIANFDQPSDEAMVEEGSGPFHEPLQKFYLKVGQLHIDPPLLRGDVITILFESRRRPGKSSQ